MSRRVLAICLDGYEQSFGLEMMRAGEMPALARLHERSARFLLEHGAARRTGLAAEHVSTGKSPEAAGRFASVAFDPMTYTARQEGTSAQPFAALLKARTAVFDPPYFDLARAPSVQGVVGWGAHDPGIKRGAQPAGLLADFETNIGAYTALRWRYGFVWASPERCRELGDALTAATALRTRAARWLFGERLRDWDLALMVVSEPHSAVEALWHGVDSSHPLHEIPSARPAGEGMHAVYRGVDRLIGEMADAFPDATLIVFAMHGMGPNRSDIPSMVLLPELLYRRAFGRRLLREPAIDAETLAASTDWSSIVTTLTPNPLLPRVRERLWRELTKRLARREVRAPNLSWMPASRYQPYWHSMSAFALPSFYDGRVRINLKGRERRGVVYPRDYEATLDSIEALARACVDPATGETAVESVERHAGGDPRTFGGTVSDLTIVWRGTATELDHPELGRVGPVPYRRTGGHSAPYGMAYLAGAGIEPGDRGVRSAFDVVPTMIDLLGEQLPEGLSGTSLLGSGVHEPSPARA